MAYREEELGQHFLVDEKVIERLIEKSHIKKNDKILEIGAGNGVITLKLAQRAGRVLAFEVDRNMRRGLEQIKKNYSNLEIVYDDALRYSWKSYNKIVSAIPYFLSEAIIMKSIEDRLREMILIVGESLKLKLEESEAKIGIIAHLFFEITPVSEVKPSSFEPPPRVNSWIVKFRRKEPSSKVEKVLREVVTKKAKIKNAIIFSLMKEGYTKNQSRNIVSSLDIDEEVLEKPIASITGRFLMLLRNKLERVIEG